MRRATLWEDLVEALGTQWIKMILIISYVPTNAEQFVFFFLYLGLEKKPLFSPALVWRNEYFRLLGVACK